MKKVLFLLLGHIFIPKLTAQTSMPCCNKADKTKLFTCTSKEKSVGSFSETNTIIAKLKEANKYSNNVDFYVPCDAITTFVAASNEGNNYIFYPKRSDIFEKLGKNDPTTLKDFLHALAHLKNNAFEENNANKLAEEFKTIFFPTENKPVKDTTLSLPTNHHCCSKGKWGEIQPCLKAQGVTTLSEAKVVLEKFRNSYNKDNRIKFNGYFPCPNIEHFIAAEDEEGYAYIFYPADGKLLAKLAQEEPKAVVDFLHAVIHFESWATDDEHVEELASSLQNDFTLSDYTIDVVDGIKMVYVEGGTFKMGANSDSTQNKGQKIQLSSFYIGKFEITKYQWDLIMGKVNAFNSREPMSNVSWSETNEFLKELNKITGKQYRLPTEAEWEYAARGGKNSKNFDFAGSNNLDEVNWYFTKNEKKYNKANELDIYNMSGSLSEWCSDWYAERPNKELLINPTGPNLGQFKVVKGGSFSDGKNSCKPIARSYASPENKSDKIGFRLCHNN